MIKVEYIIKDKAAGEFFALLFAYRFIDKYIRRTCAYYFRGDSMNKKQQEQQNRQKNLNKFNSVTEKVKPENQNQEHNVRSEAVEPKNRQV